ncbi:hypothetical protein HZ996_11585 [Cryomorphaceae bacterium]|nr:hypothetical protein HZ996_11585 [Cryomorphaceae bacterium]
MRIGYELQFKSKWHVQVGLKYLDGQDLYQNSEKGYAYFGQFTGVDIWENLGVFASLDMTVIQTLPYSRIYTKLDVQVNKTRLTGTSISLPSYETSEWLTDPLFNLETLFGIGVEAKFLKRTYLFAEGGLGFIVVDRYPNLPERPLVWDWARYFQIGIKYELGEKEKAG